jgi:hypothetical protein
MPGLFPTLEGFFKKRTPPGVQNAQPELFQNMPAQPQANQGGLFGAVTKRVAQANPGFAGTVTRPPMQTLPPTGPQKQQAFNQEQSRLNTGMIGGRMNRRRF